MIGFEVDGEFLDLMPGFSIPIEWESGLFSDEYVLNGISTLPVPFPFTAKNKRLLKHFNIIENNLKNLQLDCRLYLGRNLWCTGKLTVAVKGETFDTDFSEITAISNAANKKLIEILDGHTTYIISPFVREWTIEGNYGPGISKIEFKINVANTDYTFSTLVSGSLANDMDEMQSQMQAQPVVDSIFETLRISDPLFSTENLKITMREGDTIDSNLNITIELIEGLNFAASTPNWPAYQRDQIRNKINADVSKVWPDIGFNFPSIKNTAFYGSNNSPYYNNHAILNYYKKLPSVAPQYLWNVPGNPTAYSLSPQLFLGYVLEQLGLKLTFAVSGDFTSIEDFYNRIMVYNNRAIDLLGSSFTDIYEGIYNFWQGKFKTGEHLPDVTLKEFFTSLTKYFALGIFYRNGVLSLKTKNAILKSDSVLDWTNKSFRIYDELNGNFISGFSINYLKDSTDSYLTENVLPIEGNFIGEFANEAALPLFNVNAGDFAATSDFKKLYRAKIKRQGNRLLVSWEYYSKYLHDYKYLDGTVILDTLASQTADHLESESGTRQMLLPRIEHTGASKEFEMPSKASKIRYLLFWNLQPAFASDGPPTPPAIETFSPSSDPDIKYPFGLMDNKNMGGTVLGPYSLKFEGEDGIFLNFHKSWLDFMLTAKKLKIQILLSSAELLQLDLSTKIQIGSSQFLISKIATSIGSSSRLLKCTVDLYKI